MIQSGLHRRTFLAALAAAGVAPALAQSRRNSPKIRSLLAGLAPTRLPGVAAMIGRGSAPGDFIATGTLAAGNAPPVDPDTLWRAYSMTKPVTGIATMLLVERGLLKLDQDIGDILPAFRNPRVLLDPANSLDSRPAAGPITVRHLLTHTAGLGYAFMLEGPLLAEYQRLGILPLRASRGEDPFLRGHATAASLTEFADRLATTPLLADPGTKWIYGVGLDLLGRVIEVASGQPFAAFVQRELLDPLGMASTFWQVPQRAAQRLVTNHVIQDGKAVPLDPGATSIYLDPPPFPFGGAGLVTSARDYDRFLAMLLGKGRLGKIRVMKPETAALAMSNLLPAGIDTANTFADGQGFGAGGYVVTRAVPGGRALGAFGWEGIAATIGWVDPARNLRACGFAQYLPDPSLDFTADFMAAVYADLG